MSEILLNQNYSKLKFWQSKKYSVIIFNDENHINFTYGNFISSTQVETKNGERLLCLVKGKPFERKGKQYISFKRQNKEPFLRNWENRATTKDKILYFLRKNELFLNVTKEYNKAFKENNDFSEIKADNTTILRKDIIVLSNNEKIFPFSVSENDYMRTELNYMQQNKILSGLVRHMAKDSDSNKKEILTMIIFLATIIAIVFFSNGGVPSLIWSG